VAAGAAPPGIALKPGYAEEEKQRFTDAEKQRWTEEEKCEPASNIYTDRRYVYDPSKGPSRKMAARFELS
jgi:hypothetical protein